MDMELSDHERTFKAFGQTLSLQNSVAAQASSFSPGSRSVSTAQDFASHSSSAGFGGPGPYLPVAASGNLQWGELSVDNCTRVTTPASGDGLELASLSSLGHLAPAHKAPKGP